jgi:hypothetical protein
MAAATVGRNGFAAASSLVRRRTSRTRPTSPAITSRTPSGFSSSVPGTLPSVATCGRGAVEQQQQQHADSDER